MITKYISLVIAKGRKKKNLAVNDSSSPTPTYKQKRMFKPDPPARRGRKKQETKQMSGQE